MNWFFRVLTCSLTTRPSPTRTTMAAAAAAALRTTGAAPRRIVHLNHAGASPPSEAVLQRVVHHLRQEQVQGGYAAAENPAIAQELETVYHKAAQLIGATSTSATTAGATTATSTSPTSFNAANNEIALVESATVAWTRLFYAFCQHQERRRHQDDEKIILVSEAEYAANVVAACQWARTHPGWSVRALPSVQRQETRGTYDNYNNADNDLPTTGTGKVDTKALWSILSGRDDSIDPTSIALVCITHVPTNSGIVNPCNEIGRLLAHYNKKNKQQQSSPILYLADTCQSIGQIDVNVQRMQCHGLVATGRKYLRAPRGTGFLYVSHQLLTGEDALWPSHVDHFGVPLTVVPPSDRIRYDNGARPLQEVLEFAPRDGARRFEFWESNIASKLGLGQALTEVLEQRGQTSSTVVATTILQRAQYLVKKLKALSLEGSSIRLHRLPECGIVSFWVPGIESSQLAQALQTITTQLEEDHEAKNNDECVFEVSVVPATSTPLDSAATGVPDLLRASVSYTTTEEEIDLFCQRLREIIVREQQQMLQLNNM